MSFTRIIFHFFKERIVALLEACSRKFYLKLELINELSTGIIFLKENTNDIYVNSAVLGTSSPFGVYSVYMETK